jgi:L-asparagine transporter-like permease
MKRPTSLHLSFFLFSTVLAVVVVIFQQVLPKTIHEDIWSIFGFVAGLSYLLSAVTQWLYTKSPEYFIHLKLLGMLIRILSSLGFIGILVVLDLENIILFIANFFLLFLFFLIFDIYYFISNLRPNSK